MMYQYWEQISRLSIKYYSAKLCEILKNSIYNFLRYLEICLLGEVWIRSLRFRVMIRVRVRVMVKVRIRI